MIDWIISVPDSASVEPLCLIVVSDYLKSLSTCLTILLCGFLGILPRGLGCPSYCLYSFSWLFRQKCLHILTSSPHFLSGYLDTSSHCVRCLPGYLPSYRKCLSSCLESEFGCIERVCLSWLFVLFLWLFKQSVWRYKLPLSRSPLSFGYPNSPFECLNSLSSSGGVVVVILRLLISQIWDNPDFREGFEKYSEFLSP